jgi:hypothetical protein
MSSCASCFTTLWVPPPPAPPPPPASARRRWFGGRTEEPPAAPPPPPPPSGGACPTCGRPFDEDWAAAPTTTIALAGARTTGKSIYIAVMIHRLEQLAVARGMRFSPLNPAVAAHYDQHYRAPLLEQRGLLRATMPASVDGAYQREPLVYVITTRDGRRHHLAIRDVAGEDLERPENTRPGSLDFLRRAGNVFFLYDPLKVGAIASRLAGVIPPPPFLGQRAEPVLETVLSFTRGSGGRLAVIMSKFDVIQRLRDGQQTEHWARIMRNPGSTLVRDGAVDSGVPQRVAHDRELLDAEVRSLLHHCGAASFLTRVEHETYDRPDAVRFFAVSALGEPPAGEDLHTRGIAPFRCLDPMSWAMEGSGVL